MSNKLQFDIYQPVIVLPIVFKGKVTITAQMALDTGATYLMVPWKMAKVLGLDPEKSKETTSIITASGILIVPIVTLESVSIASSEAQKVKAVVHDLPPSSYVDGLLGLSFLKNFKITLNFLKGELEITDK